MRWAGDGGWEGLMGEVTGWVDGRGDGGDGRKMGGRWEEEGRKRERGKEGKRGRGEEGKRGRGGREVYVVER